MDHHELGQIHFYAESGAELLFCENETNSAALWGSRNASAFVKDGIGERVVNGRVDAVNPAGEGTKAAAHVRLRGAGGRAGVIPRTADGRTGGGTTPRLS